MQTLRAHIWLHLLISYKSSSIEFLFLAWLAASGGLGKRPLKGHLEVLRLPELVMLPALSRRWGMSTGLVVIWVEPGV